MFVNQIFSISCQLSDIVRVTATFVAKLHCSQYQPCDWSLVTSVANDAAGNPVLVFWVIMNLYLPAAAGFYSLAVCTM